MATAQSADSLVSRSDDIVTGTHEQPTSLQRRPKQSEIRDLGGVVGEESQSFDLQNQQRKRAAVVPPPMTLHAAVEHYAGMTHRSPDVLRALQTDDLPLAVAMLIHENLELRNDNASWQSNFEELRSMSIAQQEESDARVAVADDQRLQSLEQLERTRSELIELESYFERTRLDCEQELEALREQRDLLERELGELGRCPDR